MTVNTESWRNEKRFAGIDFLVAEDLGRRRRSFDPDPIQIKNERADIRLQTEQKNAKHLFPSSEKSQQECGFEPCQKKILTCRTNPCYDCISKSGMV
jgi:hypothetical protein